MVSQHQTAPIGIFDSGVGGLSVMRAIQELLPNEFLIYLADQAHVPYGPRSLEEVRAYAQGITRYMLAGGAKLIVVACNPASAAALHDLRQNFPQVPFVGMEPAVKPAAERTNSGTVGVLAYVQGPLVQRQVAPCRLTGTLKPSFRVQVKRHTKEARERRIDEQWILDPVTDL